MNEEEEKKSLKMYECINWIINHLFGVLEQEQLYRKKIVSVLL